MPFHASVACSQGCPLQRIEARISHSSLFMLQDVWVLESYPHWDCNEGRAYYRTPAFQLTMETLERLEGVASLSCVANIAGSDVQSPALISVRQECGWKMTLYTIASILKAQGLASTEALSRHHGRGHRLCFIARMLKAVQASICSHTCSRHLSDRGSHSDT